VFFGKIDHRKNDLVVNALRTYLTNSTKVIGNIVVLREINVPEFRFKQAASVRTFKKDHASHETPIHVCVCNHGVLLADRMGALSADYAHPYMSYVPMTHAINTLILMLQFMNANTKSIFFDSCWSAANAAEQDPASVADGCWARIPCEANIPIAGHVNDPMDNVSLDSMVGFWDTL
jgi:hypothetical protein